MNRTRDWRRDQNSRIKNRVKRVSNQIAANSVHGTKTLEDRKKEFGDWFNRQHKPIMSMSNKCQCEWCAGRKVTEPLDSVIGSWYDEIMIVHEPSHPNEKEVRNKNKIRC